jgi:hypothetical protein
MQLRGRFLIREIESPKAFGERRIKSEAIMESRNKKTIGASSNKTQQKRSLGANSEIGAGVRADDTTEAEKRGPCFASSADRHILDRQPGFGAVRPTMEEHQTNKGLNTLSSDSRKAPLPEEGVRQEIHRGQNDENIVYDDASTVT